MSVISPWIFYVIDLLSKATKVFLIIGILLPSVFFISYFIDLGELYGEEEKIFKEKQKGNVKKVIITTIIGALGIVAIPNEETMYKMLVAKYVTYENIDKATESIKDGVDYIFEKLDKE